MRLGYVSNIVVRGLSIGKKWTLDEYLKNIAAIGYDCAAIFCFNGQAANPECLKSSDREQLAQLLEELGISISLVGGYGGTLLTTEYGHLSNDDSEVQYIRNYMKKCIDLAVDLGCGVVGDLSGSKPDGLSAQLAWEKLSSSLGEICDYAHDKDVYVALELGISARGAFIHSVQSFIELAKRVGSSALKLNYDPSNMILGGEERIIEDVSIVRDYIINAEVKGVTKGTMINGYQFARPCSNSDINDHKGFLKALKNIGYNRAIAVEELPSLYGSASTTDPFDSARVAYRDVVKILEEIEFRRDMKKL
jgi:sugar phosphate isomerase/epimerase